MLEGNFDRLGLNEFGLLPPLARRDNRHSSIRGGTSLGSGSEARAEISARSNFPKGSK